MGLSLRHPCIEVDIHSVDAFIFTTSGSYPLWVNRSLFVLLTWPLFGNISPPAILLWLQKSVSPTVPVSPPRTEKTVDCIVPVFFLVRKKTVIPLVPVLSPYWKKRHNRGKCFPPDQPKPKMHPREGQCGSGKWHQGGIQVSIPHSTVSM